MSWISSCVSTSSVLSVYSTRKTSSRCQAPSCLPVRTIAMSDPVTCPLISTDPRTLAAGAPGLGAPRGASHCGAHPTLGRPGDFGSTSCCMASAAGPEGSHSTLSFQSSAHSSQFGPKLSSYLRAWWSYLETMARLRSIPPAHWTMISRAQMDPPSNELGTACPQCSPILAAAAGGGAAAAGESCTVPFFRTEPSDERRPIRESFLSTALTACSRDP
mmetsp:Transcript_30721/g.73150  ORF Transcript_30721/g.73150 Transcript_30721/m.73150 type:complete len:217 (+) Transcript_30721:171-821(+)